MKKTNTCIAALIIFLSIAVSATPVYAAKGDQGVDWAIYQGETGRFGYAHDKFTIAQIGGYNQNGLYDQWTYKTQVAAAVAQGKRAHTYIWYQVGGSQSIAKTTLDYFLPKIQTPKGSIIALDYESGASGDKQANTDAILYGMRRIKQNGYTPMYYSYKPYTVANVDYQRILKEFPNSLWIAAYPDYNVTPTPNYNVFPSMDGVAIYQFTSTYIAGGLDGNVDLTGITDNGYKNGQATKPETVTPAIEEGKEANSTPKNDIKVGDTVKVNFSSANWTTGETIPDWIKGNSYTVQEVSNNKILLSGVYSWINVKDVEILSVTSNDSTTKENTYVVQNGDTLSGIAAKFNTTYQNLQAINGLSNPDYIYFGQVLNVTGTTQSQATYHRAVWGDSLSVIAAKYGTTVQNIKNLNGLTSDLIYSGVSYRVK